MSLTDGQNKLGVASSQPLDPISPRLVRLDHNTLVRSSQSGRRMVAGERQPDSAHRALGCANLEGEYSPVRRPLGREPAQRGREAGIDVGEVAELGYDRPGSTSFAEKLDATNVGLWNT